MSVTREFVDIVEAAAENERLDLFLTKQRSDLTRSFIQKLIREGHVTVNAKLVKPNYRIQLNDRVAVMIPEPKPMDVVAEHIPLSVLYEDDDIIVVNKTRGMVVHPAAGNYQGTLVNALLEHCKNLSGINGEIRPGIVHRLDKDTSGVMVAAKTDRAHISLAQQIKDRTASRIYWAIVHGNIKEDHGSIHAPIGRHTADRKKMAVTFENSREATTNFTVLTRFGEYTLVECKLLTGRTHQIRVHMAYIGHPVVGDPKYGVKKQEFSIVGQALHARELRLIHPVSGEPMQFTAPLPSDMSEILHTLQKYKR
ncbi:putative RNA pseudouridine synthase YlyB [Propionispora sp. 2/2-37]|uniref:RluA family pseudouridine synthase n=1 Tax=Propionispora sp. 2/2-37 TaxID=1677858 RepID=UPI0006BB7ABE|nr:RluA family pseudouridine synthase [Propionispora sp. 2/2-37]CUH94199.1 putative RNA pseudouridine synthase YlyB [Propionispora sp. 2/2-37]